MTNQIILNSCLYLIGFIFLSTVFSFSVHLRHISAYIMGIAVWGIIFIFCMILSVPLKISIILTIFVISTILFLMFKKEHFAKLKSLNIKKEFMMFLVYFSFFILVNVVVCNNNYVSAGNDGWENWGMGDVIGKAGYFPSTGMPRCTPYMQGNFVLLPVIFASSHLFNIDVYHSIFPLSAIYFLFVFSMLFFIASEPLKLSVYLRMLLGLCGALLIVTIPAYWFHAFNMVSYLHTSIYFSICLLSIFIYKNQRCSAWLVLAAINMAVAEFCRSEIPFFIIIPVVLLMSVADLKKKDYLLCIVIFTSIALPYYLFKGYHLGLRNHWHGWSLGEILVHLAYMLSCLLILFKAPREKHASLLPNILISGLLIFIILSLHNTILINWQGTPDGMLIAVTDLIKILSISKGLSNWGGIWLAIACCIVLDIAFIKEEKLKYFIKAIILFFSFRLIIYSIGLLGENSRFYSGNLILLHIMPTGIFYMTYLMGTVLSRIFPGKALAVESQLQAQQATQIHRLFRAEGF